ncbi:hypothetical protein NCU09790 [Neurospora crassa OR74A]|uniref:Uncharacterized protein n=1 Tax=Neurospora crassa (strain ATCC 24698 / 74-OR23-1A / CBS 708.71 / DSM 1257 / FGSC 987) TaxID=367110 RepID=Q7S603_NEUCR|nr:hypothetical protein NCU09790 [Neurospora crassa OR74A]EAA30952.2 hypothetical protein NCU09790 [Neurospora crassa OR74A]|eukprot:XP_960188.2 hypothetical protein NCU09790 [Neurospora crassa OR74A]
MPPPLSQRSDENSSEDEVSDSGSLEAVPESDSLQKLRESAMDVLASRLTSQHTGTTGNHVTGKLINNVKRAPADDFANDHVAKYPKLDQEDEETSDEEEEYSSSEEDEEDEDDDEEGQGSGSYPYHSAPGRFIVSEDVSPWIPRCPSADKLPLHPDLVGMTSVDLFQHALPNFQLPRHLAPIARHLAERPIKRMPILGKPFVDNKPDNFSAYFLQATGHLLPDEQACARCRGVKIKKRYVGGTFVGCVAFADSEDAKLTGGACANCWYGRQGSLCSFRNPADKRKERLGAARYNPLLISPPPPPPPPPPPKGQPMEHGQQLENTGQVHPAFLASVSSASPAYTPFLDYPHMEAQIVQQNNGEPPILPRPDGSSSVNKVTAWETRYRRMSTDKLRATHGNLVEWQEDLNTRLLAMNKVLLDRLEKRENSSHTN